MLTDYDTLSLAVDTYFADCDSLNEAAKSKLAKPYTVSGLLLALDLDKDTFDRLCQKPKFRHLFRHARAKIEAFIEENALTGALSCNAAMNSLKYNFGWGDAKADTSADTPSVITLKLDGELLKLAE